MVEKLSPEELYLCCDLSKFDFDSTSEIKPQRGTIGQERAMSAVDFGLNLDSKGFNIFILGESGTGKMTSIRESIKALAKDKPVPPDWCYVFNFKNPDIPSAISLPAGGGIIFQKDMKGLLAYLQTEIPKIFESKEYDKSKSKLLEKFQGEQKELFSALETESSELGFSIRKTVSGLMIVPVKESGDPLTEEEFEALDLEHKKKVEEIGKSLQEKLDDVVRTIKGQEKNIKDILDKLERDTALVVIGNNIEDLQEKYQEHPKIAAYFEHVKEDILDNLGDFKGQDEPSTAMPFVRPQKEEPTFTRYEVNVLVNNADLENAPCIFESNPTYFNLVGRIEHKFQYGVAMTDFSMIKPGSLHQANGGYIVIDALDMLRNMFSYDVLKRSIKNREVKFEDMWEQYKMVSTASLKPEAISLDIKVIIIGSQHLYYTLYNLDEEYRELFKVKADFESRMERNNDSMYKYAEFIASKCEEEGMMHFDKSGVAKIIEYGTRMADHREKLSSKFSDIADLLREAHYWAGKNGNKFVSGSDVDRAMSERIYRNNRIENRMQEAMEEDTIIVETSGRKVGQVNGLAVLSMGDYSFGKPSRITCATFAGKAGVVNIERETKMSGKIHEKAILIISNYLGSKYGKKKPISISASITFEQLYSMIEGDSATCAELYTLLSSISGVPLRQNLAVTGSMDQHGDVQPIGGVNEKIEGFFDLCKARGLDKGHGVIIPRRNVKNLMVRQDVVDAVKNGLFSIYPIDRMEEGLEILTGMSAGELDDMGQYHEDTINYLVTKRFEEITEVLKPEKKNSVDDENNEKA
ncbi:Lon protease family protein [Nitrospirota bacterium]